jgi:serine phosphatase RsbU (regulator of sigma subunit)
MFMRDSESTAEAAPPPELAQERPLRVLVIEDNLVDARLIQIMVSDAGGRAFEIERADRLEAGLKRLATENFGMVLLDLSLPDSHGLGTFARVHQQFPHIPIIVMSGLDDERVAVSAVHEGAQDYLVKGQVSGPLLVRAMRYAVERKRTSDQLARYAEELRVRNVQMEADFNMAREIQQVFLPQQYPTFPRAASLEQSALQFHHRYIPAAAVGGDFFNVYPLNNTTAGIFICDVMGHGMRAALVTAILRGLVEQLMPVTWDAGKLLGDVNHSLHTILRRTDHPMMSTAFYMVIDCASREFQFACAGHPSPLRIRRQPSGVEPLKNVDPRHGPALGLFAESVYPTCRCPLDAGDAVLLFTDGLYEASTSTGEEYGLERLLSAVRQRALLPMPRLFDEVLKDVQGFGGSAELADDVCLLSVELTDACVKLR